MCEGCTRTHNIVRVVYVGLVDGEDQVGDVFSLFHERERKRSPPLFLKRVMRFINGANMVRFASSYGPYIHCIRYRPYIECRTGI